MFEKLKNSSTVNGILYVGGLLSLKFLLSVISNPVLSVLSLFLSVAILFIIYKIAANYRIHYKDDIMSYGEAFRYLFQLYFLGSIIYVIVYMIYTTWINPEFFAQLTNQIMEVYDNLGVKVDDAIYDLFDKLYKPLPMTLFSILGSAISAAFWAFIIAFFVKKEKSIFDNN